MNSTQSLQATIVRVISGRHHSKTDLTRLLVGCSAGPGLFGPRSSRSFLARLAEAR